MTSKPSKAAALRFLDSHIGRVFETVQTAPGGRRWEPGPRTLARKGADTFTLDESTVRLSPHHTVTALTDTSVTVEWRDGDGALIHTTTYMVVPTSTYAWIVDSTKTLDEDDKVVEQTDPEWSSNGTTGPHDAPADLVARLAAGEGRHWRTLYDVDYDGHPQDERVSHEGRYLDVSDVDPARADEVDCDAEGGPLYDFAQPDSGAIEIQYEQPDGTWKSF
jgi:hypothetical protein